MKNYIIYFVIISFLFQNCYTYKTIDLKETSLIVGKKYKIRQESKFIKGELKSTNDTIAAFKGNNHITSVTISEIQEIQEKKFSTLKTIGLVLTIGVGAALIIGAIEMNDFDLEGFTIPY